MMENVLKQLKGSMTMTVTKKNINKEIEMINKEPNRSLFLKL